MPISSIQDMLLEVKDIYEREFQALVHEKQKIRETLSKLSKVIDSGLDIFSQADEQRKKNPQAVSEEKIQTASKKIYGALIKPEGHVITLIKAQWESNLDKLKKKTGSFNTLKEKINLIGSELSKEERQLTSKADKKAFEEVKDDYSVIKKIIELIEDKKENEIINNKITSVDTQTNKYINEFEARYPIPVSGYNQDNVGQTLLGKSAPKKQPASEETKPVHTGTNPQKNSTKVSG